MPQTLAETFKERLYLAAGINDETLSGWMVAQDIGVGVTKTIKDRNGVPSAEKLVAIADALGKSVDWLLGLDKEAIEEDALIARGTALAKAKLAGPAKTEEFVYVPRYNIKASAGNGYFNDGNEGPRFTMAFRRYWVTHFLRVDPKHLSVISIKGDSMDPVLKDGDNILVNHVDTVRSDGIYVLRLEDSIVVKRTLWERPDFVHIISENPAYPMIDYKISHDSDFGVIGRVVWFGRQI
ncbi:MAG: S24 family peptidase [Burkholderia sp.]